MIHPDANGTVMQFDLNGDGIADLSTSGIEVLHLNSPNAAMAGDFSNTGLAKDTIHYDGTSGNDTFDASSMTSNEEVIANGGDGNDRLIGSGGNDLITGGAGHDVLTGGLGADLFAFDTNSGKDAITDFSPGIDKIVLEGSGMLSISQILNSAHRAGRDVVLTLDADGGSTVTLSGVQARNLHASDFVLGDGYEVATTSGGGGSGGSSFRVGRHFGNNSSHSNASAPAVDLTTIQDASHSGSGHSSPGQASISDVGGDQQVTLLGIHLDHLHHYEHSF